VIEPFPLPDAPAVIASQLLVSVAVHPQPDPAVTWMVPVDSSAPTLLPAGAIAYEQTAGGVGVGAGEGGGLGAGVGAGVGGGTGSGDAPACSIVAVC
jgi:hypothetical protein